MMFQQTTRPGAWRDSHRLGGPARSPELVVDGTDPACVLYNPFQLGGVTQDQAFAVRQAVARSCW